MNRPGSKWSKGASFGVSIWAILFTFFEANMPFNILGEPFSLVLLELSLQLIAMAATGLVIAWVYSPDYPTRRPKAHRLQHKISSSVGVRLSMWPMPLNR